MRFRFHLLGCARAVTDRGARRGCCVLVVDIVEKSACSFTGLRHNVSVHWAFGYLKQFSFFSGGLYVYHGKKKKSTY